MYKTHIYFREDLQELKELPINEENCYYLGEFTERQKGLMRKYLDRNIVSFTRLSERAWSGKFR